VPGRSVVGALVVAMMVAGGCGGRVGAARERRATSSTTTSIAASPTTSMSAASTTSTGAGTGAVDCPAPTAVLTSGVTTVEVDGEQREYRVTLPAAFEPAAPTPVILDFHGSGSAMNEEFVYSGVANAGPQRGYLVLTPQGTGSPRGWSLAGPGKDDAFVEAMLAAVGAGACVDPHRVFAVGISNGSAYAALMACRHPDRIAAVGMVAATLVSLCPVDHPMPAIAFHGTADPIVPYTGGNVSGRRSGTEAPGAESAIAQWAQRNGCSPAYDEQAIAADVTRRSWTGCADDASVQFFSITGGGHTWPGALDLAKAGKAYLGATTQSISATTTFLDFFDRIR